VVYGAYAEACVDHVISEMVGVGPKLHVVSDAIANVQGDISGFVSKWQNQGVESIALEALKIKMFN
jgi:hypothetical protein